MWVAVVDVAEDFVGWQGLGLVVVGVGYSCVLVMDGMLGCFVTGGKRGGGGLRMEDGG